MSFKVLDVVEAAINSGNYVRKGFPWNVKIICLHCKFKATVDSSIQSCSICGEYVDLPDNFQDYVGSGEVLDLTEKQEGELDGEER